MPDWLPIVLIVFGAVAFLLAVVFAVMFGMGSKTSSSGWSELRSVRRERSAD